MTEIGFDTLALAGLGFMAIRFALKAIRRDIGRSERIRVAREARHAF